MFLKQVLKVRSRPELVCSPVVPARSLIMEQSHIVFTIVSQGAVSRVLPTSGIVPLSRLLATVAHMPPLTSNNVAPRDSQEFVFLLGSFVGTASTFALLPL